MLESTVYIVPVLRETTHGEKKHAKRRVDVECLTSVLRNRRLEVRENSSIEGTSIHLLRLDATQSGALRGQ